MGDVVVVGGGLAGLAISALLAKQGIAVRLLEARGRALQQADDGLRSINLALSARGLRTLDLLGLSSAAIRNAIPLYGRCIHLPDFSDDFQSYDLVGTQAIYSIRRSCLWQLLREAAEANGAEIHFDARSMGFKFPEHSIRIADSMGKISYLFYEALIGSDGAHSSVRRALVESGETVEEIQTLGHGYLELCIPVKSGKQLNPNALHIWARGEYLLIALPNTDGSFTATLFFPWENHESEAQPPSRFTLQAVFHQKFPDAVALLPNLTYAFAENPFCRLSTCRCRPWTHPESVLLIGDAAHTVAPFYGQGMNCALEDCRLLMQSVERFHGNWRESFKDFERNRRPDAEAITVLSDANYNEMSHHVVDKDYKHRREIERALQMRFPTAFVPQYAMIAFTTVPYALALARGAAQADLVDRLANELDRIEDVVLDGW